MRKKNENIELDDFSKSSKKKKTLDTKLFNQQYQLYWLLFNATEALNEGDYRSAMKELYESGLLIQKLWPEVKSKKQLTYKHITQLKQQSLIFKQWKKQQLSKEGQKRRLVFEAAWRELDAGRNIKKDIEPLTEAEQARTRKRYRLKTTYQEPDKSRRAKADITFKERHAIMLGYALLVGLEDRAKRKEEEEIIQSSRSIAQQKEDELAFFTREVKRARYAIAHFRTPTQEWIYWIGQGIRFLNALACGIASALGVIMLMGPFVGGPLLGIMAVALFICGTAANWLIFGQLPDDLLRLVGRGPFLSGFTQYISPKGGKPRRYRQAFEKNILFCILSLAVGITFSAMTFDFINSAASILPFLHVFGGGIFGAAFLFAGIALVANSLLMMVSFRKMYEIDSVNDFLKQLKGHLEHVFSPSHPDNRGKSQRVLWLQRGVALGLIIPMVPIGLWGLFGTDLTGTFSFIHILGGFGAPLFLAIAISYALVLVLSTLGQLPFTIETSVKWSEQLAAMIVDHYIIAGNVLAAGMVAALLLLSASPLASTAAWVIGLAAFTIDLMYGLHWLITPPSVDGSKSGLIDTVDENWKTRLWSKVSSILMYGFSVVNATGNGPFAVIDLLKLFSRGLSGLAWVAGFGSIYNSMAGITAYSEDDPSLVSIANTVVRLSEGKYYPMQCNNKEDEENFLFYERDYITSEFDYGGFRDGYREVFDKVLGISKNESEIRDLQRRGQVVGEGGREYSFN